MLHSRWYREGSPHSSKQVLIIGSGNSAVDLATDLAPHATEVHVAMRSPRHFIDINKVNYGEVLRNEKHAHSYFRKVYARNGYPLGTLAKNRMDLSEYGIGAPDAKLINDPYYIPNFDQGFSKALAQGGITVIPQGVKRLTKEGVQFDDDSCRSYDTIIAATGYCTGLEELIADRHRFLEVREGDQSRFGWMPKTDKIGQSTVDKSLYFVGYQPFSVGLFNGYGGWIAGEQIAHQMKPTHPSIAGCPQGSSFLLSSQDQWISSSLVVGGLLSLPIAAGGLMWLLRRGKLRKK